MPLTNDRSFISFFSFGPSKTSGAMDRGLEKPFRPRPVYVVVVVAFFVSLREGITERKHAIV